MDFSSINYRMAESIVYYFNGGELKIYKGIKPTDGNAYGDGSAHSADLLVTTSLDLDHNATSGDSVTLLKAYTTTPPVYDLTVDGNTLFQLDGTSTTDITTNAYADTSGNNPAVFPSGLMFTRDNRLTYQNTGIGDFGIGDFTIELTYKPTEVSLNNDEVLLRLGTISIYQQNTSWCTVASSAPTINVSGAFSTIKEYVVAIVRESNVLKLYIDGILQGSTTDNTDYQFGTANEVLYVGGRLATTAGGTDGTLKDVRISNIARYTANYTLANYMPTQTGLATWFAMTNADGGVLISDAGSYNDNVPCTLVDPNIVANTETTIADLSFSINCQQA